MIFACHIYIYATIRFELENIIFVSDLVAWWPKMTFTKFKFVCFTDPTIVSSEFYRSPLWHCTLPQLAPTIVMQCITLGLLFTILSAFNYFFFGTTQQLRIHILCYSITRWWGPLTVDTRIHMVTFIAKRKRSIRKHFCQKFWSQNKLWRE